MFDPVTVMASAAVVTAGLGLYQTFTNSAPNVGSAPPPSNYYEYDTDGNLVREQVWDQGKQGYVSKTYKTDAEKAEEQSKKKLRNQFMGYLSQTPADRIKAYDEYAATFSKQMHKDVDEQYGKTVTASEEMMNKRGLTGSRAYVDTMKELAGEKTDADVDIAEKSALAKESLAQADRNYWLQAATSMDSGIRADEALAINRAQQAANIASQGTAATLGAYAANSNNELMKWQAKQNQANQFLNTSSGLAFLYGLNKGGSSYLTPKNSLNTRQIQGVVNSGGNDINLFQ